MKNPCAYARLLIRAIPASKPRQVRMHHFAKTHGFPWRHVVVIRVLEQAVALRIAGRVVAKLVDGVPDPDVVHALRCERDRLEGGAAALDDARPGHNALLGGAEIKTLGPVKVEFWHWGDDQHAKPQLR